MGEIQPHASQHLATFVLEILLLYLAGFCEAVVYTLDKGLQWVVVDPHCGFRQIYIYIGPSLPKSRPFSFSVGFDSGCFSVIPDFCSRGRDVSATFVLLLEKKFSETDLPSA